MYIKLVDEKLKYKKTGGRKSGSMKRKERSYGVGLKGSVGRSKKRAKIFHRPQPNNVEAGSTSKAPNISTASDKKITAAYKADNSAGYRVFHIETLFRTLRENLCCKECGGSIVMTEVKLEGLGGTYGIACENCVQMKTFKSSPTIDNTRNVFEINRRAVLAMRCIGQGLESLTTFCGVMDLPPAVKRPTYNAVVKHMVEATSKVADAVFHRAVEEEVEALATPDTRNITVQCDGTWQKRGYKSLNGVCTVIGSATGKVFYFSVFRVLSLARIEIGCSSCPVAFCNFNFQLLLSVLQVFFLSIS